MENIGVGYSVQATNSYSDVEITPVIAKENVIEVNEGNKEQPVDSVIEKGIEKLNKFLSDENAEAIISKHKVFGDTMIKIVNKTTHEVLLEIPPEKFLDMIAKMCEIVGLKLDKKA